MLLHQNHKEQCWKIRNESNIKYMKDILIINRKHICDNTCITPKHITQVHILDSYILWAQNTWIKLHAIEIKIYVFAGWLMIKIFLCEEQSRFEAFLMQCKEFCVNGYSKFNESTNWRMWKHNTQRQTYYSVYKIAPCAITENHKN